ncbi:MAG: type II toxin-antitoxin system RelE/ParE family toxin [Acidobacteriota bacterium]|nr:type II toxin-antitoxin system RelE/ParE family toxin [Acidobacteriota bacterium]
MVEIVWTSPAFSQVEALPAAVAFEIVRRVDMLEVFPEMGAPVASDDAGLRKCRQLIVKRTYRAVYEYDEMDGKIYVFAVQHCRQRLPLGRDLKRRQAPDES